MGGGERTAGEGGENGGVLGLSTYKKTFFSFFLLFGGCLLLSELVDVRESDAGRRERRRREEAFLPEVVWRRRGRRSRVPSPRMKRGEFLWCLQVAAARKPPSLPVDALSELVQWRHPFFYSSPFFLPSSSIEATPLLLSPCASKRRRGGGGGRAPEERRRLCLLPFLLLSSSSSGTGEKGEPYAHTHTHS